MRRAIGISAGLHLSLLALSFLSLDWLGPDEEEPIRFTEVTMLTESQFDAAISRAPDIVAMETLGQMMAPSFGDLDAIQPGAEMDVTINDVVGPDDPSEADAEADLTAVLVTNQVEVDSDITTLAPSLPGSFDSALSTPTAQADERRPTSIARPAGISSPRPQAPSLRIDTTPAAPPPEDAETADDTQEEIPLSQDGTVDQQPQEATAPEEAATEIVPEIAEDQPDPVPLEEAPLDEEPLADAVPETGAPTASVRPQPRPEIRNPQPEPIETAEPAPTPEPEPAEAQPVETAAAPSTIAEQGPPIGSAPIDAVRRGMQNTWNVGALQGAPDWETLVVTLRFELTRDGQISSDPVPIGAQRTDGAFGLAIQTARRAIVLAARQGVFANLPAESYGRWQTIEMTFDPGRNSIGFGS